MIVSFLIIMNISVLTKFTTVQLTLLATFLKASLLFLPVTVVLMVNVFSNCFVHTIDNFLKATLILYLNCIINISDEHVLNFV